MAATRTTFVPVVGNEAPLAEAADDPEEPKGSVADESVESVEPDPLDPEPLEAEPPDPEPPDADPAALTTTVPFMKGWGVQM